MYAFVVGLLATLISIAMFSTVSATSSVVISQVQAGGVGAAAQEMISLYNNGSEAVDVTGWCVTNKLKTDTSFITVGCFAPDQDNEKIFLSAKSFALIVSDDFELAHLVASDGLPIVYDIVNTDPSIVITGSSDTIGLYDADKTKIDEVSWSNTLEGGKVLQRSYSNTDPTVLIDTGLDTDFTKTSTLIIPISGISIQRTVVDLCALEGIQEMMPDGYGYDEAGNCELLSADVCSNLPLVQLAVPIDLMSDGSGGCYADICQNLDGLQREAPMGYRVSGVDCVELETRALLITELLPNVSGADTGNEFIEIYNPNPASVLLDGYQLQVGKNFEKIISFDDGIELPGGGFIVFYDSELGFSLLNTTSNLRILSPAGAVVSSVSYSDPKDDMSWADIDGVWQYTNQLTPAAENLASLLLVDEDDKTTVKSLLACAAGKYRHPITNRCRNIESDTAILVDCDADEYRNPETNRCRKIAALASTLAPCSEGSERNPETNRCRKVAGIRDELTPCQEGYERNPETNRCRKSLASTATSAVAPAEDLKGAAGSMVQSALIVTAGVGAIGYGLYEWRSELGRLVGRLLHGISGR